MALEQSINLYSKSKGGIIGMSTNENAVEKWFLTSHEREAITQEFKTMCGIQNCDRVEPTKNQGRRE